MLIQIFSAATGAVTERWVAIAQLALGAMPWVVLALVILWRARGTRALSSHSANLNPATTPRLSVIVPARNESLNIERCLASLSASTHPNLEVVVVDDHSEDNTRQLALAHARSDSRVVVISPPSLPDGWFGKSWACQHGAKVATGDILLFTDADTWHHPELHARLCNALKDLDADLVSVGGAQEIRTFWEKLLQPLVFLLLLLRYGGADAVNRSRNPRNKIANGQCIITTKAAYWSVGGHASVRSNVAEDMKLAQVYFAAGRKPMLELALPYLSTRMYRSLAEVVRGWGKNLYVGSAESMPENWVGRRILTPLLLLLPPMLAIVLPLLLAACLLGEHSDMCLPLLASNLALLLICVAVFAAFRVGPHYALLYPLGATVLLYIVASAISRGHDVTWKGRRYVGIRGLGD
jgi:chlorobactene glucosyltransferase